MYCDDIDEHLKTLTQSVNVAYLEFCRSAAEAMTLPAELIALANLSPSNMVFERMPDFEGRGARGNNRV
jgi:hypothetical protein